MRPLVLGGNWISNLILTSISAYWLKNEPLILLVFSFMGLFSQTGENPLFGCAHGICVRKSAIYTVQCCAVLLNQRLGINPAPLMGCFRKYGISPHLNWLQGRFFVCVRYRGASAGQGFQTFSPRYPQRKTRRYGRSALSKFSFRRAPGHTDTPKGVSVSVPVRDSVTCPGLSRTVPACPACLTTTATTHSHPKPGFALPAGAFEMPGQMPCAWRLVHHYR